MKAINKTVDSTQASAPESSSKQKAVRSKKTVPKKDADFAALCESVNEQWKEHPFFVLLRMTQPAFEQMTIDFTNELETTVQLTANRPVLTSKLREADKLISKATAQIKIYLKEKYEQGAVAYYASFGMVWERERYGFPKDRNKRISSLELAKSAIIAEGFGNNKYGEQFWEDMHHQYSQLWGAAVDNDGERSKKTANKNWLKEKLTTTLNALILLLKANYDDEYPGQLRLWGFQKEKY